MPEWVIYIGKRAFGKCKNLKNIIHSKSTVHIDDSAFEDSAFENPDT